jgi:hypothetical protein
MLLSDSVGGAGASRNGFSKWNPVKTVVRSATVPSGDGLKAGWIGRPSVPHQGHRSQRGTWSSPVGARAGPSPSGGSNPADVTSEALTRTWTAGTL